MVKKIENIASTHLGRTSDGKVMKPYITPTKVDSDLLVKMPRELTRKKNHIFAEFKGYDIWNCYEVSYLNLKGIPQTAILKFALLARSECIVESKSLKLYLNSFNLVKFANSEDVRAKIGKDLRALLGEDVFRTFSLDLISSVERSASPLHFEEKLKALNWPILEQNVDHIDFTTIDTPSFKPQYIDKVSRYFLRQSDFENEDDLGSYRVRSSALRSNCRVTNQPDWADLFIYLRGFDKDGLPVHPKSEDLMKMIIDMRNQNHFHEEVCEIIYNKLNHFYQPKHLMVACFYTRRGGIDINPIRATSELLIERNFNITGSYNQLHKLVRQ